MPLCEFHPIEAVKTNVIGVENIRTERASFLIREFSPFGNGLGSSLESGYARDNTGYGFELTYLNIIHKLGVFSMALFLYYLSTIILIVYRILHRKHLISSYFLFWTDGLSDNRGWKSIIIIIYCYNSSCYCSLYIIISFKYRCLSCYEK